MMNIPDSQPPARPCRGGPPAVSVGNNGRAVESLEVHDIRWHVRAGLPFWVEHFGELRLARLENGRVKIHKIDGRPCPGWLEALEIPPVSYSVVRNLVRP
jgi:hypothetical protein